MLTRLLPDQPHCLAFTPANQAWGDAQITAYPNGHPASAIMFALGSIALAMAIWMACAGAVAAQNQFEEDRLEMLVQLVCANGGSMRTETAAQILPANGFTMQESREIVFELEDRGLVVETGLGTLTLTDAACAQ